MSLVSQVLNGDRNFVKDKAFNLSVFFEMSDLETEYFLALHEENVAVGIEHKTFLKARLKKIKK